MIVPITNLASLEFHISEISISGILETGYPDSIMNNKMFRLAKQLRNDRRVLDFHQCIFDVNHREILYKEYSIT